jgi:hypothetical protein
MGNTLSIDFQPRGVFDPHFHSTCGRFICRAAGAWGQTEPEKPYNAVLKGTGVVGNLWPEVSLEAGHEFSNDVFKVPR